MNMSSASPFGAIWSRSKKPKPDRIKSPNLPPSVLGKPKRPFEDFKQGPSAPTRKPEYTADKELEDIKRGKEARERSARVEADQRAMVNRPRGPSLSDRATDGAVRTGSLSDRKAVQKGRGYWHPERIAERSVKRRERYERQRYG